jgi:hypothetical protein
MKKNIIRGFCSSVALSSVLFCGNAMEPQPRDYTNETKTLMQACGIQDYWFSDDAEMGLFGSAVTEYISAVIDGKKDPAAVIAELHDGTKYGEYGWSALHVLPNTTKDLFDILGIDNTADGSRTTDQTRNASLAADAASASSGSEETGVAAGERGGQDEDKSVVQKKNGDDQNMETQHDVLTSHAPFTVDLLGSTQAASDATARANADQLLRGGSDNGETAVVSAGSESGGASGELEGPTEDSENGGDGSEDGGDGSENGGDGSEDGGASATPEETIVGGDVAEKEAKSKLLNARGDIGLDGIAKRTPADLVAKNKASESIRLLGGGKKRKKVGEVYYEANDKYLKSLGKLERERLATKK